MKTKILDLRKQGKSYNEIVKELGCSKSTVSYHCSTEAQKFNRKIRLSKNKALLQKVEKFQVDRKLRDRTEDFQRERINVGGKNRLGIRELTFRWRDVIDKYGWETICYLTGKKINLKEFATYQFDHVVPKSKGGTSTIDNLGIACKEANQAKHDMNLPEFLNLCKEVLEHNGYEIRSKTGIDEDTDLKSAEA